MVKRKKAKKDTNPNSQFYDSADKSELTDNVVANRIVAPYLFIFYILLFNFFYKLPIISKGFYGGSLALTLISIAIYLYSSSYYQPDLDVDKNRPGMTHFPIGQTITKSKNGKYLKLLFFPICHSWYWLWHPFAKLFTHRGICHWPLVGVWTRNAYLILVITGLMYLEIPQLNKYLYHVKDFLEMFFPYHKNFLTIKFWIFCSPVFISDIVHSAVDFYDSRRNGKPFCPYGIPRGIISKSLKAFFKKDIPL